MTTGPDDPTLGPGSYPPPLGLSDAESHPPPLGLSDADAPTLPPAHAGLPTVGDASTLVPAHVGAPAMRHLGSRRLPEPGERLGHYLIERELARGGMGVVFVARDVHTDRRVALKVLAAQAGDRARERFEVEALAAARIVHPNVVPVHDAGVDAEGRAWLAMALVEGESLHDRLAREGPLAGEEAARLLLPLCRALAQAHAQGVLHRDLKPGNVLLDRQGNPALTDFGLARLARDGESLTKTGDVMGTPSYMAPEQASGEKDQLGEPTDVYGLGGLLYTMLCGHPPFEGKAIAALLTAIIREPPRRPRELYPPADRQLEAVALRCLAKEPADRYPSATALADELRRYQRGERLVALGPRRRVGAVVFAVVALLLAAGGFALNRPHAVELPVEAPADRRAERAAERAERAERARQAELARWRPQWTLDAATVADLSRLKLLGVMAPWAFTPTDSGGLELQAAGRGHAELRQVVQLPQSGSVRLVAELDVRCLEPHPRALSGREDWAPIPCESCIELRLQRAEPRDEGNMVQLLGQPQGVSLAIAPDPEAPGQMRLRLIQLATGTAVASQTAALNPGQPLRVELLVAFKNGRHQVELRVTRAQEVLLAAEDVGAFPGGKYWVRYGSHPTEDGRQGPGYPEQADLLRQVRHELRALELRAFDEDLLVLDQPNEGDRLPGFEAALVGGRALLALRLGDPDAARAKQLADALFDRAEGMLSQGHVVGAINQVYGMLLIQSAHAAWLGGAREHAERFLLAILSIQRNAQITAYGAWAEHLGTETLASCPRPEDAQLWRLLLLRRGEHLEELGDDLDSAREAAERLSDLAHDPLATPDVALAWARVAVEVEPAADPLLAGRAWTWCGNPRLALATLEPLLRAPDPDVATRARLLAGFAHYRLGDWDQALAAWDDVLQPGDEPLPYADLGTLREQFQAWQERRAE